MAKCIPFLVVADIARTIRWYENIGFTCIGTNHIWEPDCELNWANLEYEGASFMIGPELREKVSQVKDASLYFSMESIDGIEEMLRGKSIKVEVNKETFYGRDEVSCLDVNGYRITFSCDTRKK